MSQDVGVDEISQKSQKGKEASEVLNPGEQMPGGHGERRKEAQQRDVAKPHGNMA